MHYYCSYCGSLNTFEIDSDEDHFFVGEECTDGSHEVFDNKVILLECKDCEQWTYPSQ